MGTRNYHLCFPLIKQDHPHAYGDKWIEEQNETYEKGSSPRVWGQETAICGDILTDRIIPTRMGTRLKKSVVN